MLRTTVTLIVALTLAGVCEGVAWEKGDAYIRCETTAGDFTLEMYKKWAPHGYNKFMELVGAGFFDGQLIYRAIKNFVVQFGIAADPDLQKMHDEIIKDDPMGVVPFTSGIVSFAGSGPGTRSTHMFIADSPRGDKLGKREHEVPVGRIYDARERTAFFDAIHYNYGDLSSQQRALVEKGNSALSEYPDLSVINRCYKITYPEARRIKKKLDDADAIEAARLQAIKDEATRVEEERLAMLARVEKILQIKSPKTLKKLPKLLKHWAGKEQELLKNIEEKHGVASDEEL
eukprot:TRINITY_DN37648_c0_g1_i1.p1 TRINITY_DN37648_c0_g1~~TRINITY_DN37648_c0_g1_i1.p1  ORF type:complete len:304 (+),score=84.13 TRINITY_DN37648_c0_g1_i1:49-912(+)